MGTVSPIGNNVADFWNSLVAGKSGAATITHFDASRFRTQFANELKGFDAAALLDKGEVRKTDPFTQYALVATDQAIKDSGLDFSSMDPLTPV